MGWRGGGGEEAATAASAGGGGGSGGGRRGCRAANDLVGGGEGGGARREVEVRGRSGNGDGERPRRDVQSYGGEAQRAVAVVGEAVVADARREAMVGEVGEDVADGARGRSRRSACIRGWAGRWRGWRRRRGRW